MRHKQKTKELSLEKGARVALIKTLAVSLIREGKIKTTDTKAKVLKPMVERLVTKAKAGTIASRRFLTSTIGATATKNLVDTIAPKYKDRQGGYLRITKLNDRKSDGAKISVIEFV